MNLRLLLAAALLAAASIFWFSATPSAPQLDVAANQPHRAPSAESPATQVSESSQLRGDIDPLQGGARGAELETVVGDWRGLTRRLNDMGDRMKTREVQQEADALFTRWREVDPRAAQGWLEGHRGDVRFDRLVANTAQAFIAAGEFESAQKLAAQIVEASTRDWVNEEVWSVAFARQLVSAEDLTKSGLSEKSLAAIRSGSRRD